MSTGAQFRSLSERDQEAYRQHGSKLVAVARDHAIPVLIAPPVRLGGLNPKINGATGFVLQLPYGAFLVTASHVLSGYEERLKNGESLNWQVGNLPPFNPLDRIVSRSPERDRSRNLPPIEGGDRDGRDILLLELFPEELQILGPRCIIQVPQAWPLSIPEVGDMVLLGGYPKTLRDINIGEASVGAGPCSMMLPVSTVGDGYFNCQLTPEDLISFDEGTLPDLDDGSVIAGISGGPALLVASGYPVVGVITGYVGQGFHVLRVSTLGHFSDSDLRRFNPRGVPPSRVASKTLG